MSTHAATVYFAVCENCNRQSPFKATAQMAINWEVRHNRQKHKKLITPSKMAGVGPYPKPGGH